MLILLFILTYIDLKRCKYIYYIKNKQVIFKYIFYIRQIKPKYIINTSSFSKNNNNY